MPNYSMLKTPFSLNKYAPSYFSIKGKKVQQMHTLALNMLINAS